MQWRGGLSCLCALVTTGCASVHYPRLTDAGGCAIERVAVQDGRAQFQFNGLSPDGRTLAVGWEQQEQHGAYLLDLRTGARTPLPAVFDNAVSFSPDGRRLISAARSADRRTEIVELVLATGATRTIASDPAAEFLPSYSPDMSRVYFNSYRSGRSDLYVVQLATGALTRLTTFDGYDAHAQISPDGTRLAFHREVSQGQLRGRRARPRLRRRAGARRRARRRRVSGVVARWPASRLQLRSRDARRAGSICS